MSSTAATAKASASDKVDVSFVTDDEEETSSSSEDETTSSSESGDGDKSDGDGDADDESEMPTFTLSLQPSTGTSDADDALPDLSRSATTVSKQETQQETVVTKTSYLSEKTSTASETETKIEVATSQSTCSTSKVDGIVSAVAEEETPSKSTIPAKEEVEEEEEEEEESEESEEETEDGEEEVQQEEQNLPSSSTVTASSAPVSTKTDTKEDLTITYTKLPVTESEINVEEVEEEEHIAIAVVETKTIRNAEKSIKTCDSSVTKVEKKHSSDTIVEEESSIKATAVAKQAADVKIEADEKEPGLSKTAAAEVAKLEVTNDTEAASLSSVPTPDTQPSKKTKKETANKKATLESSKVDAVDSTLPSDNIAKADDVKHEDSVKETIILTEEKATKLSAVEATVAKVPKTSKNEESVEFKAKEQSETLDSPKSAKSRKTKVDAKEIKQEVTKTVKEERNASVVVAAEQNTEKSESEKSKTSKTISDANAKPKVSQEKAKESHKHEKSDSVVGLTTVEKAVKLKSEELIEDVASPASQTAETNIIQVAVNGSADVASPKETAIEPPEGKLPSKKKSKHSSVDGKESEVKSVPADGPAVASDQQRDDRKCESILESNVALKSAVVAASETGSSSITVADSELEKNVTETQCNDDKSLSAANISDEVKVDGSKVNGVEDEGKLLVADDEEFRPRRNSIDEFIKRILAEAREEQKKILDSCAVSSGGETTSEITASSSTKAADGLPSSKGTDPEPQQQQQPIVNDLDVGSTTRTARRSRKDFDIDDELADISRYYAKRTLVDRVSTNEEEPTQLGSAIQPDDLAKSKIVANCGEMLPLTSNEEMLHFVPQRRESTASVVRESSRPVRVLVDQQTNVIRQLTETSRAVDELDNEVRLLRQSIGGREALYASIGAAIRDELRIYEMELTASGERLGQQRLPGGGRFIREQFVAQCATELLQRSATTNGPRLDRAATVDDWTRVGRRRSGSFSAAADEDVAGGTRIGVKQWLPTAVDREPTDLMIQYRHSRSGSVVSDRGYSSIETADESRASTSSLMSRLTAFNGSTTSTELDLGRYSRASSEARPSYTRSQSISDDWLSTGSSNYTAGRQYVVYKLESTEDTSGDLDIGHRISAPRPPVQPSHRRYQPPSVDATTTPQSRLYVRRGSLQSYGSYDGGSANDAGRSFNSRFLSRVREKKALGGTTSRQTSGDRPFRSRFLKSSSVTGSTSTPPRSSVQYDSDDN